jgi:lipopolysaccharide export system protein LptA
MLRFIAVATALLFAIYWFHIRLTPEDALAYEKLTQESLELRTKKALEETPAHQEREGVQKDIWTQDETRHFRIRSKQSNITIGQKKDGIEAIEHLNQIQCIVQNEFILEADEGFYNYPSHQFTAQKNCRLLQGENQIEGSQIHLDLIEEKLTYENPIGKLALGPLHFSASQLLWDKKIGKLYLVSDVHIDQPNDFNLTSDLGTIELEELKPSRLILEGNVRLISERIQDKKTYAVADTLIYDPIEKTLLFSAAHKVLLWQEGLSLSASEIFIRQDQTVEGRGDVHFAFDLEEQNYIEQIFKPYL